MAREAGGIRSIAFPSISTGAYGFPKHDAAGIALGVMRRHATEFERIIACVFDTATLEIYQRLGADQP